MTTFDSRTVEENLPSIIRGEDPSEVHATPKAIKEIVIQPTTWENQGELWRRSKVQGEDLKDEFIFAREISAQITKAEVDRKKLLLEHQLTINLLELQHKEKEKERQFAITMKKLDYKFRKLEIDYDLECENINSSPSGRSRTHDSNGNTVDANEDENSCESDAESEGERTF